MRPKRGLYNGGCLLIVSALLFVFYGCAAVEPADTTGLSPEEHFKLGAIYESRDKFELALREYRQAAARYGIRADAYFAMGNVYLRLERLRKAEVSYKRAIHLKPSKGIFHNNLAWVYIETGELDKAEEKVRMAMWVDAGNRYVYLDTLGVIKTRLGSFDEAGSLLTEAASKAPAQDRKGLRQIYEHLFDLYMKTGEGAKADLVMEKIRKLR